MSDTALAAPTAPNRRVPRWLWLALVGSLAVNLLIIGIAGATLLRWRGGGPPGGPYFAVSERLLRSLPAERRQALREVISRHRELKWQNWRELRNARWSLAKSLRSEPFDRSAFEAALTDVQQKELGVRGDFVPVMGDLAAALTAEERQKLLEQLRRERRRSGGGRGGHDGWHRD